MRSTALIDDKAPMTFGRLTKTNFFGVGPKKSLDQQISFINENMHMARRIKQQAARLSCDAKGRPALSRFHKQQDDPHMIRGDYYGGGLKMTDRDSSIQNSQMILMLLMLLQWLIRK